MTSDSFLAARQKMIESQLRRRDITDQRVLHAMEQVPRHFFVPEELRSKAYADRPLPIGCGQTISQPYIVALMTQLARPTADSRALDVGTGCGYQAAILSELCREVYSIEIVPSLAEQARLRIAALGRENIDVRCGDGYRGCPEQAPFDLITVAAAPDHIPPALIKQLAIGGRLVIPVGGSHQNLRVVQRLEDGSIDNWRHIAVSFVPMTGEAQRRSE